MCGDGAVFAERIRGHSEAAADGACDFPAGDGDAAEIFGAVIVRNEINGAALRGETRATDAAVEGEGQNLCFASGGRSDGEMMGGVDHVLDVGLADEGEPLAVGRPSGRAIGAGIDGDLREVGALVIWRCARRADDIVRGDDPDVGVVVTIGIGCAAVASER